MKLIIASISAAWAVGVCVAPALAHHSAAMFDETKEVVLAATIKQFQYTNPHSWLIVTVAEGGKTADWSVQLGPPTALQRMNIKRSSFMIGEKVTVRIHPMKDGRNAGELVYVEKADGTILGRRPGAA